jgi:hypothetical protein
MVRAEDRERHRVRQRRRQIVTNILMHPRLVEAASHDRTLQGMIKRGKPLTREQPGWA